MNENDLTLVSVIIPIYNVSDYLSQCIESVIAACDNMRTVLDVDSEILLIDDGSPDSCAAICDDFARRFHEIVVIHKKNGGVGDSRNIGLSLSSGDYISFVDSDDVIADSFFSDLFMALEETDSDIAVCDHTTDIDGFRLDSEAPERITLSSVDAVRSCLYDGEIRDTVWDKLYNRNVVKDLLFPPFEIGEDVFFLFHVLGNAQRIVKIKKELYYYRQREGSVMQYTFSSKWLGALAAKEARHEYIVENMPDIIDDSAMVIINTCIYDGQCAYRFLNGNQLSSVIHHLSKTIKMYKLPKSIIANYGFKRRIWLKMAKVSLPLTCWLRYKMNVGF